jgi:hypothetical protein
VIKVLILGFGDWGLGIGVWGLGIEDMGLGICYLRLGNGDWGFEIGDWGFGIGIGIGYWVIGLPIVIFFLLFFC